MGDGATKVAAARRSSILNEPNGWLHPECQGPWLAVGAVCVALHGQLDASIVTLALPSLSELRRQLGR